MLKSQIKAGTEYAFREKRAPGTPFQRVRILEHIRGNRWKAEWIEPNPGLVHYVESGQLTVPWKEHKAFLKDESNAERLREHNGRQGFERDCRARRGRGTERSRNPETRAIGLGCDLRPSEGWTRYRSNQAPAGGCRALMQQRSGQKVERGDPDFASGDCHQTVTKEGSAGSISDHSRASAPGARFLQVSVVL